MPVENPASLKVDNEKLRGLLTRCDEYLAEKGVIRDAKLRREIRAALSQQAEPAPAQDEREAVSSYSAPSCEDGYGFGYVDGTCIQSLRGYRDHLEAIIDSIPGEPMMPVAQHERIVAALTRPEQTEQQPVSWTSLAKLKEVNDVGVASMWSGRVADDTDVALYAAPIAQTAPQGLRIVLDGPPGPEAGRFVEVENAAGRSVNAGEWRERADGLWELVLHAAQGGE